MALQDKARGLVDASACLNDPQYSDVADAYYGQMDLIQTAMSDPGWQLKALKAIKPHLAEIKAMYQQSAVYWDMNTDDGYYACGKEIGAIDKIAFAPWENTMFLQ